VLKKIVIFVFIILVITIQAAQSLSHPHIWVSSSDKEKILDNIDKYDWAKSLFDQLKTRVDAKKNTHKTNPGKILSEIPVLPGVTADREFHTNMLTSASEAAILYYLTDDKSYAQYAADILSHYTNYLSTVEARRYYNSVEGVFFGDWWLESRALFPKVAITYDLLYNFLKNSTTKVYDLKSKSSKVFSNAKAQTAVKNLADIVLKSIGAPHSNHSVLAGNGALFNLLMIDDDATRAAYFDRFYNGASNDRFDAYTWTLNNFGENGVWPETYGYGKGSHQLIIQSLNVIDRYKPSLKVIENNRSIFDGFIGYENYFYPNDALLRFGDTGGDVSKDGDLITGFQWLLYTGARKNIADYVTLAKKNLNYKYNQLGGYKPKVETQRLEWFDPLELLWGVNVEASQEKAAPKIESTYHLKFAGIVVQRNYNTANIEKNGFMYYSGGATYVHAHSTGIDLELYGKGYVLGAESGSGVYGAPEHEDYRVRHAAHNTVIGNGSAKRSGYPVWEGRMNNVTLTASEPKANGTSISRNFSFATQSIDDTFNNLLQQRTNAIIRTGETSGYYFDIFRSKGKTENITHDYIYHNIGDEVTLVHKDKSAVSLSNSNKYANDSDGNVTGWKYFESVKSSSKTNKGVIASFALKDVNTYMNVHIPSGVIREYAKSLAPATKAALGGYGKKKTPVITMRKAGEAWDEAFVAVFEPSENPTGTIRTSDMLKQDGRVVGVKVKSLVGDTTITDYIVSHDTDTKTYTDTSLGLTFKGRLGILRVKSVTGAKDIIEMYIGDGISMKYSEHTLNATLNKGYKLIEPPAPKVAPKVTIAVPSAKEIVVTEGDKMYVNADVVDENLEKTELYIDGKLLRQELVAPYEWGNFEGANYANELDALSAGSYTIKVVATDKDGLTGEASFTLNVQAEAPTILHSVDKVSNLNILAGAGGFRVTTGASPAELKVTNIQGQVVFSESGVFTNHFVPMKANGVYFIDLVQGNKRLTQKYVFCRK